ncbi:hypothetical protein ES708_10291 [subsurface metagenome]
MNDTLLALVMLLGKQGADWIRHERDLEEWQLWFWIHRN